MISSIISRIVILVFGTLYPAYASYKAVRTKNVREYVKWMMYWIVFALFTCGETFTDVFLSWFPFYYEVKIILVLWLLSPATKGSSILYRKFVHPALSKREQEIDEYISKAKEQGYHTVLNLGTKGVNYATNVLMQTAIKTFNPQLEQVLRSRPAVESSEWDGTTVEQVMEVDCTDGIVFEDAENKRARLMEIDSDDVMQDDSADSDASSVRGRSAVVKKRIAKTREAKKPKKTGRRTRRQVAIEQETLLADEVLVD